jgi:hypothetical protein
MADSIIYETSIEQNMSDDKSPFSKKQVVYINDSNSGNYSSKQVTFESISLSNNGRYVDYKNGYITLPLVLTASGTDFTANNDIRQSDLVLALKNSSLNLVDSLSLDYGNNNVIQQSAKSNCYWNFKINTELSYQDELLNGATIN